MSVQDKDVEERSVVSYRTVDLTVSAILLLTALILGWANWQIGAGWAPDGPEAGYFPFYLCVLLAIASSIGLVKGLMSRPTESFVGRNQLKRVLQVAIPSLVFVAGIQWIGLYVSSFLMIAGFMRFLGKSSILASLVTPAIFVVFMFYVFEKQFTVLLPKGPIERALLY